MSIQAVAWVLEHSEATLAARLVLIAIANHANAQGLNAWPSAAQIAREAKVDRRSVQRAIVDLEELGEVIVVRRPGRPSVFQLPLGNVRQIGTGEGGTDCPRGGTSDPKRWDTAPPEPSVTVNNRRGRAREATDTSPIKPAPGPVQLPEALPPETRQRGAEWVRSLRRGGDPA